MSSLGLCVHVPSVHPPSSLHRYSWLMRYGFRIITHSSNTNTVCLHFLFRNTIHTIIILQLVSSATSDSCKLMGMWNLYFMKYNVVMSLHYYTAPNRYTYLVTYEFSFQWLVCVVVVVLLTVLQLPILVRAHLPVSILRRLLADIASLFVVRVPTCPRLLETRATGRGVQCRHRRSRANPFARCVVDNRLNQRR